MANRYQDQQRPDRGSRFRSNEDENRYGNYTQNDEGDSSVRAGRYDQGRNPGYGNWGQGDYDQTGRGANTGQNRYGQGDQDRQGNQDRDRQGNYGQGNYGQGYYGGGNRDSSEPRYGRGDDYNRDYYTGGTYAGSSADQNSTWGVNRYEEGSRSGAGSSNYRQGQNKPSDYGYGYGASGHRDRGWSESYGESRQSGSQRGWGSGGSQSGGGVSQYGQYGQPGQYGGQSSGQDYGMAQGQHRGKGPKGYTRSDERLKEMISEKLRDDHHIDASEITITVASGKVTLEGTVDSRQTKNHAEDLVEQCGVDEVQNNLRVQKSESMSPGRYGTSSTLTGATGSGAGSSGTSGGTGSNESDASKRRNN